MARHKAHRDRSDSPHRMAQLANGDYSAVTPPPGVVLRTNLEKELWQSYLLARTPEDWREHDLNSLYRIIKLEIQIRAESKTLDSEGVVILCGGKVKQNPRLVAIRTLTSLQLSIMRALNISALPAAPETIANQAKQAQKTGVDKAEPGAGLLDGR